MAPTFAHFASLSFLFLSSFTLSDASAILEKRVAAPATADGWAYYGCYTDNVNGRALEGSTYTDLTAMTDESCVAFCKAAGYIFAGTEYSQECYCGNTIIGGSTVAPVGDCSMACTGNAAEACGAGNRLTIYTSGATPPPPPVTDPGPANWPYLGCYTDTVNGRTLPVGMAVSGAFSVESCTAACQAAGYTVAGVEYADQCYCGNAIGGTGTLVTNGCTMVCAGDSAHFCGGPNRLNVYDYKGFLGAGPSTTSTQTTSTTTAASTTTTTTAKSTATGWSLLGCYTDAVGARALSVGGVIPGGPSAMTPELCNAACQSQGYTLAGVEYADECYCDNKIENGQGPAPDGAVGCNMACAGNAAEICGGANRIDVYQFGTGAVSTASTTGTKTTTTSASTSTGTGSATGIPKTWKYDGCFVDSINGRIMQYQQPGNNAMTVEICVNLCISQGYTVAGIEYSTQCFCDNFISNGGVLAAQDTDCNMACGGNANEMCGGPNRMSVYNTGTLVQYGVPATQTEGLPGSWAYKGCLIDSVANRAMPYEYDLPTTNSPDYCLSLCSQYGYMSGGMEYGLQCFCGDPSDVAASGQTFAPETDCNTPCPGNVTTFCGAGNRISYYTWTGTPLETFNYPTGINAGQYQFLIGGVVVPLITTVGINGKVTFVEKFGTGPPNSTGSFELDLSQISNFNAAWRTMTGIKTDVFCSASLTLPDRVGRQINVGGWSGVSTFGIRLYWPDGSPGVPSVNEWQENSNELQLQNGRWYPSAMIMANGSILVVGGEDGSNGLPVPTLEILPKVGGTVFGEWLNLTDPYNLYPFLAVLPSGGVFVAYYNEARILDETTLLTKSTLPNMPGAVNNPLGGRTYPLEGTMMIMPQYAPYTAPLGVLICGGSTPFAAVALDNCISIQPEVTNQNWTIERMPSKRVISSMTALPDGTYLILNGGQQGVAGFALASEPNLNAVLYDPTKPVNSRMSVMANTTIARMYHSEAILLQDGRVLVSGSDPEDPRFPEEYRVEVFIPPYLLAGLTQPSYTIGTKDWAYGGSYAITVTLYQGTTAGMKVSLLGAVSSTHGNSMGQRTFFPAFSCAGTTCTITAPPNAHVCPPGWLQLFILDGPTPSHSTWVRIGGDPASLGNWPNYPDFNLPGVGGIANTQAAIATTQSNLTRRAF